MKIYYGNRFEHVQWIKLAQNCSVKLKRFSSYRKYFKTDTKSRITYSLVVPVTFL
jgi:hypothetical protein